MSARKATIDCIDKDAQYLGSGLTKHQNKLMNVFTSLKEHLQIQNTDKNLKTKYHHRYAVDDFSASDEIPEDSATNNNEPTSAVTPDTDLLENDVCSKTNAGDGESPTNLEANGCKKACAIIPMDIRPLIKQAYNGSDFNNVDQTPVCLPMVDDDGIIRRRKSN